MRSRALLTLLLALTLASPATGWAKPSAAHETAPMVTEAYHDAQRWLHVGDLARQFACYDMAMQAYRRVQARYPHTRWGALADDGISIVEFNAPQLLEPWDPTLAGMPAAVEAQGLLYAGDLAYHAEDPLMALTFYERARAAAPGTSYAARAASKSRWVRRWSRVAP